MGPSQTMMPLAKKSTKIVMDMNPTIAKRQLTIHTRSAASSRPSRLFGH